LNEELKEIKIDVGHAHVGDVEDTEEALPATVAIDMIDNAGDELLEEQVELLHSTVDFHPQVDHFTALMILAVGKDGGDFGEFPGNVVDVPVVEFEGLAPLEGGNHLLEGLVFVAFVPFDESKCPPVDGLDQLDVTLVEFGWV